MTDRVSYDALVIVTPKDFERLLPQCKRLIEYLPVRKLIYIGSNELGELIKSNNLGNNVGFINENDIIPFSDVHKTIADEMKTMLKGEELPRGVTGWYYQQFLKMQYARICNDDYYLVWDGDTIPCRELMMFDDGGKPFLDLKTEYHKEYFETIDKLLPGMKKPINKSFISEHMLINKTVMCELIDTIEGLAEIPGDRFFSKIINAITSEKIQNTAFSEFETYGTYVAYTHSDMYRLREWHSIRYGSVYFKTDIISSDDLVWLGKDFDAISFEKNQEYLQDMNDIFMSPVYREKLTPRQIVEIIQDSSTEGMVEVWGDLESDSFWDKRVSIIVPCYNAEQYLGYCLDSLISQNFPRENMEIIVINDASTDNTLEILKRYEALYPENMLLVDLAEHIGFAGAVRNIGMGYCSGDYVLFVDADDVVEHNYIELLYASIMRNVADISCCSYDMFTDDAILGINAFSDSNYDRNDTEDNKKLILNLGTNTVAWGKIYNYRFLCENNLFFAEDLHIGEDAIFWLDCLLKVNRCAVTDECLYHYRQNKNGTFRRACNDWSEDIINGFSMAVELLMGNGKINVDEYLALLYINYIQVLFDYMSERDVTDEKYQDNIVNMGRIIRDNALDFEMCRYLSSDQKMIVNTILKISYGV